MSVKRGGILLTTLFSLLTDRATHTNGLCTVLEFSSREERIYEP